MATHPNTRRLRQHSISPPRHRQNHSLYSTTKDILIISSRNVTITTRVNKRAISLNSTSTSTTRQNHFRQGSPTNPTHRPRRDNIQINQTRLSQISTRLRTLLSNRPRTIQRTKVVQTRTRRAYRRYTINTITSTYHNGTTVRASINVRQSVTRRLLYHMSGFNYAHHITKEKPSRSQPRGIGRTRAVRVLSCSLRGDPSYQPIPTNGDILFTLFLYFVVPLLPRLYCGGFAGI